jgi:hypothetical protein
MYKVEEILMETFKYGNIYAPKAQICHIGDED